MGGISLALSASALGYLEDARKHKELVTIGVVTMIFSSFLGGLFMLLIKDEELEPTMSRKVIPQSYSVRNIETFEEDDDEPDISDDDEAVFYCPNCEEELEEGQKFCGKCGMSTEIQNICPECNNINKSQDIFCRNCGHKLKD